MTSGELARRMVPAVLAWILSVGLACSAAPREEPAFQGPALRSTNVQGVSIDVMAEGAGPELRSGELASIYYRARTFDGRLLDASRKGEPLLVILDHDGSVIPGLHLALRGMKVGELRRATIPSRLAYQGKKMGAVPTDREMIFELELLKITPAP